MSVTDPRARFREDGAASVSPQLLIVMLFERLLRDVDNAQTMLASAEPERAHHTLVHAQEIVEELLYAVRPELWDGGQRLVDLYDWVLGRLVEANVKKSAAVLAEIRPVVAKLHDTWQEAYRTIQASAMEGVA